MLQNLFFLFLNFKTGHETNCVKNFEKHSKMPSKKKEKNPNNLAVKIQVFSLNVFLVLSMAVPHQ